VHDAEAADLLRLLARELQVDGGGVAGEVGWVCCSLVLSFLFCFPTREMRERATYH